MQVCPYWEEYDYDIKDYERHELQQLVTKMCCYLRHFINV